MFDLKCKLQIDYGKGRENIALEQTMKAQKRCRGVALLFLELRC
jgi:hypothetical protein